MHLKQLGSLALEIHENILVYFILQYTEELSRVKLLIFWLFNFFFWGIECFFSTINYIKCVVSFCSELRRYESSPDDSGSVTLNSFVLRNHAKFGACCLEYMLLKHTSILIEILVAPWNLHVTLDKLLP